MFGNNSKKENASNGSLSSGPSSNSTNSIVAGTNIKGSIQANSDIRIDGEIEGDIHCSGKVIIGPQGVVKGEVNCQNAVIEGTFEGVLKVKEVLNVKENAKISGDINTDQLLVQAGAVFNVSCNMGGQTLKSIQGKQKEPVELVANLNG